MDVSPCKHTPHFFREPPEKRLQCAVNLDTALALFKDQGWHMPSVRGNIDRKPKVTQMSRHTSPELKISQRSVEDRINPDLRWWFGRKDLSPIIIFGDATLDARLYPDGFLAWNTRHEAATTLSPRSCLYEVEGRNFPALIFTSTIWEKCCHRSLVANCYFGERPRAKTLFQEESRFLSSQFWPNPNIHNAPLHTREPSNKQVFEN